MDRQARYGKLALPFDSHPISQFIRKAIEKTKYKKVMLANVALLGVVFTGVTSPSHAFDYKTIERPLIEQPEVKLTTERESGFLLPVSSPIGVSQWYHAFHPGVDIRAPRGSDVISVAEGTVIEVEFTNVGYGHYVRVAHEGTVSTLYAHMDSVVVKVGQHLAKGEKIGTIGTTGWSTGPHLHFEIYEGINTVNPSSLVRI